MILLVDTSVWIEFFAGRDTPQTRFFKDAVREGADIALTGVILAEILQGIPSDSEFGRLRKALSSFRMVLYTSPPDETWSMRGHRIRYNYLHDIHGFRGKGCFGVYLDDCFSSADISCNVFYDMATAILIGGGRDNTMTNNMFIKCDRAFSIDARGLGWAKGVGDFATKELITLNYKQPPWSTRYPELLNILEDEPLAPKGNVVARNICWGGKWGSTEASAAPYITFADNLLDTDPRFRDALSFQLEDSSPAFKLGFQ